MSESSMMSCGEFDDVAAELALGVLTGRERADAVAHMEHCDACRETIRQLSITGEELVGLLPHVEPPPGFEVRVLARIGIPVPEPVPAPRPLAPEPLAPELLAPELLAPELLVPELLVPELLVPEPPAGRHVSSRRPLSRRLLAVAAVTLAVVGAGLGGWGLRGVTSPAPSPTASSVLSSATLFSSGQHDVGEVYYHAGTSRWMYMSVDLPSGLGTVTCQLRTADGRFVTVGSFWLASGYGSWAGPDPGTHAAVTGARLLSANGAVIATASF
jgi:hypothetical protein